MAAALRHLLLAAIRSLSRAKAFIQTFFSSGHAPSTAKKVSWRRIEDFLDEASALLLGPTQAGGLLDFSKELKRQFREALLNNTECMLPSYNHRLPTGCERGQYLALDVGGSTLRVALVQLGSSQEGRACESRIVRIDVFTIGPDIKKLRGIHFFEWMAGRILETVSRSDPESPLPMALAWSFPIEQTSPQGGCLRSMGKGFLAADGLLGQDLGGLIQSACRKRGLQIELAAMVNDSTAALLSEAYVNPSTRFGLILGTGVNIAVHLPVTVVGRPKFGDRPDAWFDAASHVIVNTELGMFGKDILPLTRWDHLLTAGHPRPTFQPLEHLVSGHYLGEICRLAVLEAITTTGILGGVVPPSLHEPYSLDTQTLSAIEADTDPGLQNSRALFNALHPSASEPEVSDMAALRALASFISRRSAAIVAASLFALWQLKAEAETDFLASLSSLSPSGDASSGVFADAVRTELDIVRLRTLVAFNGSVIEHYPGYRASCQGFLDELLAQGRDGGDVFVVAETASINLVAAKDSCLLGAATALACSKERPGSIAHLTIDTEQNHG